MEAQSPQQPPPPPPPPSHRETVQNCCQPGSSCENSPGSQWMQLALRILVVNDYIMTLYDDYIMTIWPYNDYIMTKWSKKTIKGLYDDYIHILKGLYNNMLQYKKISSLIGTGKSIEDSHKYPVSTVHNIPPDKKIFRCTWNRLILIGLKIKEFLNIFPLGMSFQRAIISTVMHKIAGCIVLPRC